MPQLPQKKVGIVACSGEEMAEGTVTRLAALKLLEELRPNDTVTICLPLFLAGGEGDRAFARFYPTIAIDGCELRCAARATEQFSGKPAAEIVVTDLVAEQGLARPQGLRRLDEVGQQAVDITAQRAAVLVDELLEKRWSRRAGQFVEEEGPAPTGNGAGAGCACGGGIPVQKVVVNGREEVLIALPAILDQFRAANKPNTPETARELLEMVKIYNPIPAEEEEAYLAVLSQLVE
jgi:uncharacterized metal-binding protein